MSDFLTKYLQEQLERTNHWLAFAEAKNAALIAFDTAIISFLLKEFFDFFMKNNQLREKVFIVIDARILFSVILIIFLISLVISLASFLPIFSLKNKFYENNVMGNYNLLYFKDLVKFANSNVYIQYVCEKYSLDIPDTKAALINDYAEEILENSRIAVRKYLFFQKAAYCSIIGIVLGIIISVWIN